MVSAFLRIYLVVFIGVVLIIGTTHASEVGDYSPESDCFVLSLTLGASNETVDRLHTAVYAVHKDQTENAIINSMTFMNRTVRMLDMHNIMPVMQSFWDGLECEVLTNKME